MAIGEVILGAFLAVLLEKLASKELLKFLHPAGIDVRLKKWRRKLSMIKALLNDAENKQSSNEAVKEWLTDLEDLVYDLDDLVDKLNTEALQNKLIKPDESTSQVQKLFSSFSTTFSIHDFISESKMDAEFEEINSRLEELVEQVGMLSLVMNVMGNGERTKERLQPTSVVEESEIYGRQKQKEDILNLLLGVESSDRPIISVIPIVGMGGVGKTTLAQLLYNDDKVKEAFEIKAWACVSDEFDATRVTKTILGAVSSVRCDYDDFNMLQVKLKETLYKKKFLVVLDDFWNDNYGDWDILRRPFLAGNHRSKIIITTRNEKVAQITSQLPAYHLAELSDADALSLLAQHSLGAKNFYVRPDLREIGKSIVRRCKNLPLAVKVLGGLLRTVDSPEDWKDMLNSKTWIAEERNGILPALRLSYQYLPPPLKRCFTYCAVFPKDYEFDKSELVHLWLVEGFLEESKKLGFRYFDELLARSFFQQSSANTSRFVMHDLIHDLATFVAGDKCFTMMKENIAPTIPERVCYFSISRHYSEHSYRIHFINRVQGLRTFLALPIERRYFPQLSARILPELWPHLYRVRVLSLTYYRIYELPDSIGDLKHLRYLNLAHTSLKLLPESISTLVNLKVLILRDCKRLAKLPSHMENLFNLCHLDIAETPRLRELPPGMDQLTSLQTLSKMVVSKGNGMRLESLRNLSLLQGEISIEELQNVASVQEAIDAGLVFKPNLDRIELAWSDKFGDSRNENLEMEVLSALKPHETLSSLVIKSYGGSKLSDWIGDPIFSKLANISFKRCRNCTSLPPLGRLPFLRKLKMSRLDQVKIIGSEFFGNRGRGELPFPSLESLSFKCMPNWEEWHGLANEVDSGFVITLARLRKLKLYECRKLVKLPILSLPSLCKLFIGECDKAVLKHMYNLELRSINSLTLIVKKFGHFPRYCLYEICPNVGAYEDVATEWASEENQINLAAKIVDGCPESLDLQGVDLLPVLQNIQVEQRGGLELLPSRVSCLQQLKIEGRPPSMTLQDCSGSLEHPTLGSLTNLLGSAHIYSYVTRLGLIGCKGLESFPGSLPTPNLRQLKIRGCRHLKSLPHRMDLLLSLRWLLVDGCPSLIEPFPQGNTPPNLTLLTIIKCGKFKSLRGWELPKLTSLLEFRFKGEYSSSYHDDDDEEYDDQHYLPPSSLTTMNLSNLPNLEVLPRGFQNLPSLQRLHIKECPKLRELPLKEELLDKLTSLGISKCPLLEQRCLKNKGDYWPIIAHNPDVQINGHDIQDPDAPL